MNSLDIVLLALATVLVLFLPGFVWSFVFFDSKPAVKSEKKTLEVSERIMWSFVLSLAIVPLSFFIINSLVTISVNGYTILGLMALLCLLGAAVYWLKDKHECRRSP